ncbi:URC4/urg3 family protein [Hydrogenophaga sp. 5NK40-0174]
MAPLARQVAEITRQRYPDLKVPFHSRWRHFEAGGFDRVAALQTDFPVDAEEGARRHIDLAVVSVLLDAGAGPEWSYEESGSAQRYSRSEGLGVASLHAFRNGLFSSDEGTPLRADAKGLRSVDEAALASAFQVRDSNPLIGVSSRAALLRKLGDATAAAPQVFGEDGRPGHLYDYLTAAARGRGDAVTAQGILTALLTHFSSIWPSDNCLDGQSMGDCWKVGIDVGDADTQGWVPFHKLSQWLTYSLLEPFEWAGSTVAGQEALTALPEYRNGGLLIDGGVLEPLAPNALTHPWYAGDPLIVEWRALTIALLDELAPLVSGALGCPPDKPLPLACILEGGTWAAGRALAAEKRDGLPPLNIVSDGTVF